MSTWVDSLDEATQAAIATAVLPVDHQAAAADLETLLSRYAPTHCLLTGLARGETCRLERLARRPAESSLAAGPTFRVGAWPWARAGVAMTAADTPVRTSIDAGGYVCETVYRSALDWRAQHGAPEQVAFLHLPPLDDAWPRERLATALGSAISATGLTAPSPTRATSHL